MKDEQQQNLNYTPCSEATQRPQSLPWQTGTMLSPSPFSLQISALLLGARQQSKEDIVLFEPIPGTAAQQQHGNLGREQQCLGLNSCMGHTARGCPAAAEGAPSHPLTYWASLVPQTTHPYGENWSHIKETSPHPQVLLLTAIGSAW